MSDTLKERKIYRILTNASSKAWDKIAFWTTAKSVDAADGNNLETKVGAIKGITTSTSTTTTGYAADATVIKTLNDSFGGYKFTTKDGKIAYYKASAGADSAVPFSGSYSNVPCTLVTATPTTSNTSTITLTTSTNIDSGLLLISIGTTTPYVTISKVNNITSSGSASFNLISNTVEKTSEHNTNSIMYAYGVKNLKANETISINGVSMFARNVYLIKLNSNANVSIVDAKTAKSNFVNYTLQEDIDAGIIFTGCGTATEWNENKGHYTTCGKITMVSQQKSEVNGEVFTESRVSTISNAKTNSVILYPRLYGRSYGIHIFKIS